MRNLKKIFSLLLSLLLLLSIFTTVPITASAEESYAEIKVGDTVSVTIENGGDIAYFRFVPDEDMTVSFSASSDSDTYGYLYDAEMNQLAYNDDGGKDSNFKISYTVTAGQTYYFGAKYYSSRTGSFDVELIETPEWEHDGGTVTRYNGGGTDIVIPSSLDGETITAVGDYAFEKCTELTSVTIPDSVTSIGYEAFSSCYNLTSVTIPDSVTSIENRAFYNCTELTSVTIPSSVTTIGENAFSACWILTNINVNSNNQNYASVDGVLFSKDLTQLICYPAGAADSYTVPDTVTYIGNNAFYDCRKLKNITIPHSVTSIGSDAFYGCESLKSISIPDSVKSIGSYAFWYCYGLTNVTIGNGLTSIGVRAFSDCSRLGGIAIPDSVTSIGEYALGYRYDNPIKNFYIQGSEGSAAQAYAEENGFTFLLPGEEAPEFFPSIKVGDTVTVDIEYSGDIACLKFVPDSNMNISFSSLSNYGIYCYLYDENMEEIVSGYKISYEVTASNTYYLGAKFYDDSCGTFDVTLEGKIVPEIKVGDTLTVNIENTDDIVYFKFIPERDMAVSYTSVSPSRYDDTDGYLYDADMVQLASNYGSPNFKLVFRVTAGNTYYLGAQNDYNQTGEFTVTLAEFTAAWNYERDYNTEDDIIITGYYGSDTEVVVPSQIDGKTVNTVGSEAFRDRTDITSVTIPDSVKSIGYSAFYGCTALTTISIPDSVEEIESSVFYDTAWYENQPDGLVYAGKVAYRMKGECPSTVAIADGTVSITEQAFYECIGMTEIVLPDSLKSIGSGAFEYCSGLTSVVIPEGITEIQRYTFNNCTGLTSVTIPDSVTDIEYSAFQGCTSLKSITIPEYTEIRDEAIGYYWDESGNEQLKMDDLTIYGYAGTDAERYAEENGFTFVALEKPEFEYTIKNGEATVKKYNGTAEELIIPATFEGCPVTKIGESAFSGAAFTTVSIPESVTTIEPYAFSGCENLMSVTIPGKVTEICDGMFTGCIRLTSVLIPDSVTSIGEAAFHHCSELPEINIPDSVTSIGEIAFYECYAMTSVTVPASVVHIGTRAFGYYFDYYQTRWHAKMDSFTDIRGYKGTAAETYANENGFTFVALDDDPQPTGYTVSGAVTSFLSDSEDITLTLYNDEMSKTVTVNGNSASYSFADVPEGVYSLSVAKLNHAARVYEIEVIGDTELDVKLHPLGDINGDGKITNMDFSRANSHARGMTQLKGYELTCADVVKGDGVVTNMDASRINSAARGVSALW